MSKNKDVKRGIVLYIDGKAVKSDVASIKAEIRKLTKELDRMAIGSKEYNEQMAKIRNLNTILKQHKSDLRAVNDEIQKSPGFIDKMVNGFNKFGGIIVSLIGFLTGVTLALRSFREERNKLESSQASLKSLTGLDDSSIDWLTKQAKQLSTTMTQEGLRVRASANEILEAYMLVGSAKAELLGNKEALAAVTEEAMRLQAAAGDITLAEAVDAVTLSLNQFGAPAEDAARYVNVLAAGSKEGASNIASITASIKRAGVAAAGANVSIEETVALVETLAYKGITDEVAGTALKKFFLVLQTGADETNPRVVGLSKALENLKAKNMGAADIKKMFGEEGYNAAAVILENVDMVNQLTKAVTGTSVAFEQSAINSNTAAAALDQARNKMKLAMVDLGQRLDGIFTVSTNMATNLVKILPVLIDWVQEWGLVTLWLAGVIMTYNARIKLAAMLTGGYNTVLKVGRAMQLAYGIAMATVNGYTVTSIKLMRAMIITMGNHRIALAALRTATFAYAAVVNVLRLRFDLAAKALRGMVVASNIAKLFSPWGAALAVVTAITAALVIFRKRVGEVSAAQQNFIDLKNKVIANDQRESAEMQSLLSIARDVNLSYDARKGAIDKLNDILPEHLANLSLETINSEKATKAINEHTRALVRQATIQAETDRIAELNANMSKYGNDKATYLRKEVNVLEFLWGSFTKGSPIPQWQEWEEELKLLNDDLKKLQAEELAYQNSIKNNNDDGKCPKCGNKPCTCDKIIESEDAVKKQLQQLELEHGRRIAEIKKRYLEDDMMTQTEYNKLIQDAELQLLNDKLKVMGLEESQRQQIKGRILDLQIRQREELRKQKLDETNETLSANQKKFQLEAEQLAQDYKNRLISREDFLKKLLELQKIYEIAGNTPEVLTPEQQKVIDEYLAKIDEVIDKYKGAAEQADKWKEITIKAWGDADAWAEMSFDDMEVLLTELTKSLFDLADGFDTNQEKLAALATFGAAYMVQLGAAVGQTLGGAKESLGDFLKYSLQMVLEVIKQQLIAEQAAAIASITMKEITSKGFVGIATAAAKIALITAAFEAAKTAIGNFYTGGFTPSGDWDKPQGIVHSNEFVANRFAVANPAVRPVLDLIDTAQRSGTIANLTGGDIAAVAGGRSTSFVQSPMVVGSASQPSDRELMQTVRDLRHVISRLVVRLDEPIEAVGVISGRHGWKQKLDEYDQLLNNKSRRP